MSLKKANELFRSGDYTEAEKIYLELYKKNNLTIYLDAIELLRKKTKLNNKNSKNILLVTAGIKGPTAGGGIATCFNNIAINYAENNNNVEVLYLAHPYYHKENYSYWRDFYELINIKFKHININNKNYGSREMQRSYGAMNYILKNNHFYDTVIFHDLNGLAYYTLLLKKVLGNNFHPRVIISAHGNQTLSYHYGQKKITTWQEQVIKYMELSSLKMADEIIAPSNFYKEWIKDKVGNARVSKINNIINKEEEPEKIPEIKFKDSDLQLLVFYGRFERLKGLDVFIQALKNLSETSKKFNILFAGNATSIDGVNSKIYIENHAKDLIHEIKFIHDCKPSDLYAYVKKEKGVCVFPTLGETSSCVVVECILNQVRFIASAIEPIKELIQENKQSEYLFLPNSVDSLVCKIENIHDIKFPNDDDLVEKVSITKNSWNEYINKKHPTKIIKEKIENSITVIVPTCDRPELLEKSIQSLRNQHYQNYDLIIVDDNSYNSLANSLIAKKFHCKYINTQKKLYKGAACNLAARFAESDFICFFDDDDIAKPNMLSDYNNLLINSDSQLDIISCFADVFEHEDNIDINKIEVKYTSLALGGGAEVNLSINLFGKGTFLINKKSFLKLGGYVEDNSNIPMVDYRFYIKASLDNLNIAIVPLANYYYRKNSPNSLYYDNINQKIKIFQAKESIESLIINKLGYDIGGSISPMIWRISYPNYE